MWHIFQRTSPHYQYHLSSLPQSENGTFVGRENKHVKPDWVRQWRQTTNPKALLVSMIPGEALMTLPCFQTLAEGVNGHGCLLQMRDYHIERR